MGWGIAGYRTFQEAEAAATTADLASKHALSGPRSTAGRQNGGMAVSGRLKQLEDANRPLKHPVADLTLTTKC